MTKYLMPNSLDDRVDSVDDQLGACETQHVLSRALLGEERHESKSRPLHLGLKLAKECRLLTLRFLENQ